MRAFLLRRLLQTIPLVLGVTALTFLLLRLTPGDVVSAIGQDPTVSNATLSALRHRFGLDQPWPLQYLYYVRNLLLRGDLGESFTRHQPVLRVLAGAIGNTLLLTTAGACITWGLALPLGLLAAARRGRLEDRAISTLCALGLAIPEILSGLLLLMFAARTGWFPVGGMHSPDWDQMGGWARAGDIARHLALPALVVGLVPLAARMRQTRAAVLDVLALDHVVAARARGLSEWSVLVRHGLRNALPPLLSLFGLTLGALLSGAFAVEIIFSWPGLGRVTLEALLSADPYLVSGAVLMSTLMLVVGNLAADVLLAIVDPRVRDA